ncbi:MAG TPA: dienelactone hydrolase family protein, partial [Chitinophagaceae bacterium]|nr:dienelactone hydrolase family protein [Chitinophagaceae bacterium]
MHLRLIALFFHVALVSAALAQSDNLTGKKISFSSSDGLTITADLYFSGDSLPFMILCHQADYSRGEYAETAKKFIRLGYNCLAVDLRSGKEVNGITNETAALAAQKKKSTDFLEAEKDILAAIDYAYAESRKKVFLVGSSYSASLALKIAASDARISGVMAFSPGEYFGKEIRIKNIIAGCTVPVFVTSTKEEAKDVANLISSVKSQVKVQYIPSGPGRHGASCLWKEHSEYRDYWIEILLFMRSIR